MGINRYLGQSDTTVTLDDTMISEIIATVLQRLNTEFTPEEILSPSPAMTGQLEERIASLTRDELRRRNLMAGLATAQEQSLIERIINQTLGLGFLENLLPPRRHDISEIMVNPDGRVFVMPKGQKRGERVKIDITPADLRLTVDKLLGPQSKALSEANPEVRTKLARSERIPAGARVHVIGPPIANGPYLSLNIRLFEEKPVLPQQIIEWGMASPEIMTYLAQIIKDGGRLFISGGTTTGKTTLLSALTEYIDVDARIILIEDPAEIYINDPDEKKNIVSLEARPPNIDGKFGVSVGQLVTGAMRMSPEWLIVGEVRTGSAGLWLLRALMSAHAGMSTIHAENPRAATKTLNTLLLADKRTRTPYRGTKEMTAAGIRLIVQVGFDKHGIRRILQVTAVDGSLKHGEVFFEDVFRLDLGKSTKDKPVWEKTTLEDYMELLGWNWLPVYRRLHRGE